MLEDHMDVVRPRPHRRKAVWALFAASAGLVVFAGAAQAAPSITEYTVGLTPNLSPMQAAAGPDGNVWFTQNSATGAIGQVTPAGVISEHTANLTSNGTPRGITAGPDGNLWFTQPGAARIGKITPTGTITEYPGLPAGSSPQGITSGPDGNLWFTDSGNGGKVGKITTSGVINEYSTNLTPNSNPWNIVAGPDGNLWFTEHSATNIGQIAPSTGAITEHSGLSGAADDIASGPDGNLWFTEDANPGRLGRITTAGTVTEYTSGLTPNMGPQNITAGGDGRLYFTEWMGSGAVGAITTSGAISEYSTSSGLTSLSQPYGLAAGADGSIWFTEYNNPGRVGRLTVAPADTTGSASNVGTTSATLGGSATPNSLTTTYYFQYGPTASYGSQTTSGSLSASGTSQSVTASLSGLASSTTYHFRLVATNTAGTANGADQSFTTSASGSGGGGSGGGGTGGGGSSGSGSGTGGSTGSGTGGATGSSPSRTAALSGALGSSTDLASVGAGIAGAQAVLGQTVSATPVRGQVTVQRPGETTFEPITGATSVPVGSVIDTSHGAVTIVTALPGRRRSQSAQFWGGLFSIRQAPSGMTDIFLTGGNFGVCGHSAHSKSARVAVAHAHRSGRAHKSRSHRVIRQLWGRDQHGQFSTHGIDSISTVRGTYWLTQDRCDGTLTRVRQGKVSVKDLKRRRRVLVRAGRKHLARGHA